MAILALALPGFVSMLLIVTALKLFDAQGSVSDYKGSCDLDSGKFVCSSGHLFTILIFLIHCFPGITQRSGIKSNPLPLL